MPKAMKSHHSPALYLALLYFLSVFDLDLSHAQQPFLKNDQLDCYNNVPSTYGYYCNGQQRSCNTFVIFRSDPPYYDSAVTIGYLLSSDPSRIAEINGVVDIQRIPKDTQVIVPVNCSCAGHYYQHNSSYTMKFDDENYYTIANLTYQGLTTCKAMINQNKYESRKLEVGMRFTAPVRCACPTRNQTAKGVKLLMTYMITRGDTIPAIAERFDADEQSVLDANELKEEDEIYPFNSLLVPLRRDPTRAQTIIPPSPSESPIPAIAPVERSKFRPVLPAIGIGAGLVLLLLCGLLVWFLHRRCHGKKKILDKERESGSTHEQPQKMASSKPPFLNGVIREAIETLTVYSFAELEEATGSFCDDNEIKGSVYRGVINGDIDCNKEDQGRWDTYLVYEYAENGSLSDWLHEKSSQPCLSWKERVQIAFDIADGLNYLHNHTNPPYIHKDMKSSNALIDSNMRAKVANFGLARAMEKGGQMTSHVVGTWGYMAPEYLEHGLITPKIDVFAFGVVMLELLSGREAIKQGGGGANEDEGGGALLLSASVRKVLEGEGVREKLRGFVDPCLGDEYPMSLALSFAHLAMECVAKDPSSRPSMIEVHMSLLKILSSSLHWDPLQSPNQNSDSFVYGM
ncbi:protein LYK5-like protein [Cinnamomum micranthum f. kanehirae]|uniref:Protein LYK5-like protein n=1 Tax=Cinnamomum micranthum f. kanehirae TaxID=337451 RepID=A0A3S3Q418_9MAGN|nr:protein LYK5-like protein [Cinnamomum micranthum f. kanehirae]